MSVENIERVFTLIKEVSPTQYGSLESRMIKLQEEVGELLAEVLRMSGFKSSNLSESEIRKRILLESCDCLIMILDIMVHQEFNESEIVGMCENQISKWKNQLKNK